MPVETLRSWLQAFAAHQPVTPMIEAVRGLLTGTDIGALGLLAAAWWLAIEAACLAGAAWLFARRAR